MKNTIKVSGIIALAALLLAFAACSSGGSDTGPAQKKLTITGLVALNGYAAVQLYPIAMAAEAPIGANAKIPLGSSSFTFDLLEFDGSNEFPWTGSGEFHVILTFTDLGAVFAYTNGESFAELGISDFMADIFDSIEKLPGYAFNKNVTKIDMNMFKAIPIPIEP